MRRRPRSRLAPTKHSKDHSSQCKRFDRAVFRVKFLRALQLTCVSLGLFLPNLYALAIQTFIKADESIVLEESPEEIHRYLVHVQDDQQFELLSSLCMLHNDTVAFHKAASRIPQQRRVTCRKKLLQGLQCDHIYRHSVLGIAGSFTEKQLSMLRHCIGPELHIEEDGQVLKAEGQHDDDKNDFDEEANAVLQSLGTSQTLKRRRLIDATPPGAITMHRLQTAEGEARDAVKRSSTANNTQDTTSMSGARLGRIVVDGSVESIPEDRRAWLREIVGNAARDMVVNRPALPSVIWQPPPGTAAATATTEQQSAAAGAEQGSSNSMTGTSVDGQSLLQLFTRHFECLNGSLWEPRNKASSIAVTRRQHNCSRNAAASFACTTALSNVNIMNSVAMQDDMQQSVDDGSHDADVAGAPSVHAPGQDTVIHVGRLDEFDKIQQQAATPDEPGTITLPNSPSMPKAPKDLPGAAPGPSTPVPDNDLAALSKIINQPVVKLEKLPPALWGLDRIDQVDPPLDRLYAYGSEEGPGTGAGVTIYALDSGVRASHQEFKSWSGGTSRASYGFDFVNNQPVSEDCDGHGTHVAATAIGRAVGVAKAARLVSVRVLDCTGSGSISDTVAGIDWVAQHHDAARPAVVIMSLGVAGGTWSKTLEQATLSLIDKYGLTVIVASGNSAVDACTISPASLPQVITVAASNMENKFSPSSPKGTETMYKWSNTGSCVDIFAPGVEIWSACGGAGRCPEVRDDAFTWASGTSMAVPMVAGAAALYLSHNPNATPAEVQKALVSTCSQDKIKDGRMRAGTPNCLLYTRGVSGYSPAPSVQASNGG